jgi:murein DD-endopeptidase MepM/ murein hydrolase activator NlpD
MVFAHLSRVDVLQGATVLPLQKGGVTGGAVGSPGAGSSGGPHLHISYYSDNRPVDIINPVYGVNLNSILYPTSYAELGDYKYEIAEYRDTIHKRYPNINQLA